MSSEAREFGGHQWHIDANGNARFGQLEWKVAKPQTVGEMVREFHEAYNAYVGSDVGFPDRRHVKMRMDLIEEEYEELQEAVDTGDVVETIDALGDLVYVLYGKALAMGVDLDKVIAEIHRSNLTKLGEDGKPIYREDGKVLKGPNFEPPDIAGVIGL